ncbi:MAG: galactose mutarotase [Clostridia bacterium]|nr:galactose mutarotase [Clostridia bacterium]
MAEKLYDEINGKKVFLYTLKNGNVEADICNAGARINALSINGVDIALGFNSVSDYLKSSCYAGAAIGRVANRIARGSFTLNGKEYSLAKNNGENHLHGGYEGFDKKLFTVVAHTESSVTMQYLSPDGEENYPGNLTFTVKFTVENNSFRIDFSATSDKDTFWCPTNHAYFNLDGEASGNSTDNILTLNADYYTPIDGGLIPTGEKLAVKNTPFDFTQPKKISTDLLKDELKSTLGYDHNYILNGAHAAHAESKITGIKMDLYTDLPCLQFYSGGQLDNVVGKNGIYNRFAGFCLEPQFCPNAVNMSGFEKPLLKKDEIKTHYIEFKFL